METPAEVPLTARERKIVVGMSLAAVVVFGALLGIVWWYSPFPAKEWLGNEFWEMIDLGKRRRVPKGFVAIWTLAAYLVVFPLIVLVFFAGAVEGLRGRRTRLSGWILREAQQTDTREEIETRGETYIPTWLGVVLLLALPIALLLWVFLGQ